MVRRCSAMLDWWHLIHLVILAGFIASFTARPTEKGRLLGGLRFLSVTQDALPVDHFELNRKRPCSDLGSSEWSDGRQT